MLTDLEPEDDVPTGVPAGETGRWEMRWLKEIPPHSAFVNIVPRLQVRHERIVYTQRNPFGRTEWGEWQDIPTHEVHLDALHEWEDFARVTQEDHGLELAHLRAYLHARQMHPDFHYDTTTGPRKAFDAHPPEGEGWERNTDRGRNGWERFDYHEEAYWRRPRQERADCATGQCSEFAREKCERILCKQLREDVPLVENPDG